MLFRSVRDIGEEFNTSETFIDENGGGISAGKLSVKRRDKFSKIEIYLPRVLWVDTNKTTASPPRDLDYDADILLDLEWSGLDIKGLAKKIPENANSVSSQIVKIWATDLSGDQALSSSKTTDVLERAKFDPVYAVRAIADIVPNPWVGHSVVAALVDELTQLGFDEQKLGIDRKSVV